MGLEKILESVNDRKSFLKFIEALIEDRKTASYFEKQRVADYQLTSDDWQSVTIEDYLEQAKNWLEDYDEGDEKTEEITWKKVAVFLYCGKVYE